MAAMLPLEAWLVEAAPLAPSVPGLDAQDRLLCAVESGRRHSTAQGRNWSCMAGGREHFREVMWPVGDY